MNTQRPINDHFKSALAQAKHLPNILTPKVKREQQKGILRSLLQGLRGVK